MVTLEIARRAERRFMPRGGNNGGYKNSPVIGNNGLSFIDEDERKELVKNSLENAMQYFKVPIIKNEEEAIERTEQYIQGCLARGLRPTVEGWALALGTIRQVIWDWEVGRKHGPVDGDFIKRGKELIASFDADMVSTGKLNPVTYIFRAKNYYGMRDQQDIVVSPKEQPNLETILEEAELLPDEE